jgi:hypothetical protein
MSSASFRKDPENQHEGIIFETFNPEGLTHINTGNVIFLSLDLRGRFHDRANLFIELGLPLRGAGGVKRW